MNKILIVKTLMCPTSSLFSATFDGIYSMIEYIRDNEIHKYYKIKLFAIGWVPTKDCRQMIKKLIKQHKYLFNSIKIHFFNINYGKYFMLKLIPLLIQRKYKTKNKIKFILYLDHDILFDMSETDLFQYVEKVFDKNPIVKEKMIGIICPDQIDDNRHQSNMCYQYYKMSNNFLYYPEEGNYLAIASGCMFIKNNPTVLKVFNDLSIASVYGMDDYLIQEESQKNNLMVILLKDKHIRHPYERNILFKKWKLQTVEDIINNDDETNDRSYFKSLTSSINFWNGFNHNKLTKISNVDDEKYYFDQNMYFVGEDENDQQFDTKFDSDCDSDCDLEPKYDPKYSIDIAFHFKNIGIAGKKSKDVNKKQNDNIQNNNIENDNIQNNNIENDNIQIINQSDSESDSDDIDDLINIISKTIQ